MAVLRMARPVKIKASSKTYFRKRIPIDVRKAASRQLLAIPVGSSVARVQLGVDPAFVKFSLRTSDPALSKERYAIADAHLNSVWESLRTSERNLTHKEAVALSGEIYRLIVRALEDEPGPPEQWQRIKHLDQLAASGNYGDAKLLIGEGNRKVAALEDRYGGFVDIVLSRQGLRVDQPSRQKLLMQVATALGLAAERLHRNSEGDYSQDLNEQRFGQWVDRSKVTDGIGPSWAELIEAWATETQPKRATLDQWRGYLADLQKVTGAASAVALTKQQVVQWKDDLVRRGDTAKTINDSKLAAVKAILTWTLENGKISTNPAQGVRVRQKQKAGAQMQGFSDYQASSILSAARSSISPVYHWIPHLCALTGARVAEIAQLRHQDICEEEGIRFLAIRAEAGSVKNINSERNVPLHPYLEEMGFLDFVNTRVGQRLFFDEGKRRADAKKPPEKIVSKNVARWVGGLGLQIGRQFRVDPNHGWRHWFRTKARGAGIQDSIIDHIQGHSAATVGRAYGTSELKTQFEADSGFDGAVPAAGAHCSPRGLHSGAFCRKEVAILDAARPAATRLRPHTTYMSARPFQAFCPEMLRLPVQRRFCPQRQ
jgi:integrase